MTTWFTSDTHFGHANIIEFCSRPFSSLQEMDEALVRNWNARVKAEDTVWHLGDFCMGPRANIKKYRSQLNGTICLVLGNHDRSAKAMLEDGFDQVFKSACEDHKWLSHKPPQDEAWRAQASICLHGHVHELWARKGDLINVGVDVRGFQPVTLDELLKEQL